MMSYPSTYVYNSNTSTNYVYVQPITYVYTSGYNPSYTFNIYTNVYTNISFDDACLRYVEWGLFSKINPDERTWDLKMRYDSQSQPFLEITCFKCNTKLLYSVRGYPPLSDLRSQLSRACKCYRDIFVFDEI